MNYPRFTKPSTPEERDEFLPFLKRLADAALKVCRIFWPESGWMRKATIRPSPSRTVGRNLLCAG